MAVMKLFQTTTAADSPLDASQGTDTKPTVSDFVTLQSFSNFAVMTGAITAAWNALQHWFPSAASPWVPLAFALAWAAISLLTSLEGLKKGSAKVEAGTIGAAIFVAVINALVLAGAVVGTNTATRTALF